MATAPDTLTSAPATPDRSDRATFSSRAVALDDYRKNVHIPEMQALADNVYANAVEVALLATTSGDMAALAAAAANYVGLWSAQTGALAKPASVSHNGNYWALNTNLADVTAATPGVSASWSELNVGAGGATERSSAVDVTLTAASYRVQTVAMTAADKSVLMPAANTLATGGALFIVKNTGELQFVVRNTSGGALAVVNPGLTVMLHLANAGSADGVWVVVGSEGLQSVAQPVAIAVNAETSSFAQLVALSATTALLAWRDTTGGVLKACVLTITGTSVSAGTIMTSTISIAANRIRMCVMSATQVLVAYTSITTTYPGAATLNVSGTTVTHGTAFPIISVASVNIDVTMMNSTQALVLYKGTSGYCEVRTLNISGTTITAGTLTVVQASVDTVGAIAAISATQAILAVNNSGVIDTLFLATVSGTNVSLGASPVLVTATAALHAMCQVNSTQVLMFASGYSTGTPRYFLLAVSGSTVAVLDHVDGPGFEGGVSADLAKISDTKFASIRNPAGSSTGSGKHALQLLGVCESVLSTNHERVPLKNSRNDGNSNATVAVLSSTKLIVAYFDSSTYLQARVMEIGQ